MSGKTKAATATAVEKTTLIQAQQRSLAADAKRFGHAWTRAATGDIKGRYAVAQKALAVERKHGRTGIEALATEINRSVSYVYSYAAVAKEWTPAALLKLLKRAAGRIEWSHLVLLSNQKRVDPKKRAQLLTQIIDERMKPTKLKKELFPETESESIDPDLTEDGFREAKDASNDEKDSAEAGRAIPGGDADTGEIEHGDKPDSGAPGAELPPTSVPPPCVRALRKFSNAFSTLAGQAELTNQEVFLGFERAEQAELPDTVMVDLDSAKKANRDLELVCQANIKKLDQLMITVQSAIAKKLEVVGLGDDKQEARLVPAAARTEAMPPDASLASPNSVQTSGTPAGA